LKRTGDQTLDGASLLIARIRNFLGATDRLEDRLWASKSTAVHLAGSIDSRINMMHLAVW